MRQSSIWRGSLLVMHKAAWLQGGLVLCLWERGSRRRTRNRMRSGLCWLDSSETFRHCGQTSTSSSPVRHQMCSGGLGIFSMMALMWLCTAMLLPQACTCGSA